MRIDSQGSWQCSCLKLPSDSEFDSRIHVRIIGLGVAMVQCRLRPALMNAKHEYARQPSAPGPRQPAHF
ncbi:hypothetical protein RA210_U10477 [Rubrivivax sp. A210]|nr:hypothetical protein RA210_U10477 [Rubrivivax sp. A210]